MQDLKVTVIQSDLYWEDITANLAMFEEKIWQINEDTDLIILPEMFNTGFSMNVSKLAEPMNLTTFKWMRQQAASTKAVVLGSFIVKENNTHYNRMLWMEPDGSYDYYDKRHLFRLMDEGTSFSAGDKVLIKKWKGWNICPMVCYDLRFPVWSRNIHLQYDLLIYSANWPVPRLTAWDALLKARAIENQSYCIGVNRIGADGNGIHFEGHSAVYDYKGNEVLHCGKKENIQSTTLGIHQLNEFRARYPFYKDSDDFLINQSIK